MITNIHVMSYGASVLLMVDYYVAEYVPGDRDFPDEGGEFEIHAVFRDRIDITRKITGSEMEELERLVAEAHEEIHDDARIDSAYERTQF